ncbi:MAG TPA: N-acetylmuramoyl-L-alanine amidase [Phenylobacterium sp.]
MQIVNHMLKPGWYKASPNHGGPLEKPSLLVMHFTASGGPGARSDADYFLRPEAKAAAHIVVGHDGAILQVVPFNVKAWHAGKSVWRGVSNCNDFSIGIEVVNWGKLVRTEDGQVRSWAGRSVEASSAVELTHKHETAPCLWQVYDEVQLKAVTEVTRLILAAYPTIKEIVGHEDIAPHRKTDPGPAFPMSRFTSLVGGRGDAPHLTRNVIATRLNARGGPGTQFDVLGVFAKGAKLDVLYDSPGPWAQVEGNLDDGTKVVAWVADQFLA